MPQSCGAILYAFDPSGRIGIILGEENRSKTDGWLPFKGGIQNDESLEQTAIREIYEETCGLVKIEQISLDHVFSTKRKEYHIGLCEVDYSIVEKFNESLANESRFEFREKRELKFFPLDTVLYTPGIHSISKSSILFYEDRLKNISAFRGTKLLRPKYYGITYDELNKINNSQSTYQYDQSYQSYQTYIPSSKRTYKLKLTRVSSDGKKWRSPRSAIDKEVC